MRFFRRNNATTQRAIGRHLALLSQNETKQQKNARISNDNAMKGRFVQVQARVKLPK